VHLAADGTDLCRVEGFWGPGGLSVNPIDGSCWVGDSRARDVVHLAQDGTVLSRSDGFQGLDPELYAAISLSVNPTDGSCWAADSAFAEVVHLSAAGEELWWAGEFEWPRDVSVNPTDGSCWLTDYYQGVVHLAEDGTELFRFGDVHGGGVSVNPTDGSCWVGVADHYSQGYYQGVLHLAEDGTELLRVEDVQAAGEVCVNPTDGSCWVAGGGWDGSESRYWVVHLAEDGAELWRSADLPHPVSLSVNPADGSCWVVEEAPSLDEVFNGQVVHLAEDGTELWRGEGFGSALRESISVNPSDGSCWVVDGTHSQVVHLVVPGWRAPVFYDVASYHWAFEEVEVCYKAGIVAGCEDGLYHPKLAVTRDQMAVYIARALAGGDEHVPDGRTRSFLDVPRGHWAFDHIEYCVDNGVVAGYRFGFYCPEDDVTRDQMAVYVARALVAPEGDAGLADYVPADPRNFPDVPSDFWAYTHIEYCVENGVVAGHLDGLYHPKIVVTRDQMAVYVARAFGLVL
jgi:DNA-binding beta-propeller fold protein YncE